jgi:hypothetical protein
MTATHTNGTVLSADDLDLLAAVLETLLPGDGEMPPASKTGAALAIDGYLTERPALRAPILHVLVAIRIAAQAHQGEFGAATEAARVATLEAVETSHPHAFDTLLVQAYTGYYSDPDVQARLGVPSPLMPVGHPRSTAGTLDPARLDRVRSTAKPWREA